MEDSGSYRIQDISSNLDMELNRLKAQVELFWPKEMKHYLEFGLKDRMSLVELGCGPGFLIEKLLQRFPRQHIFGVEIDSFLVDYACKYLAERNFKGYKIIQGSILNTGLDENSFDFAISRLVLEHLPDPIQAVKEVYRILKPGGKVVFIDNDFEMHLATYPHIPELRELYDAYCRSRSAEGGHPRIGRRLPVLLKEGGFSNIDFEIISAHNTILGDEIFFKSEGVGIPTRLVEEGYLTSTLLGKISVQWRNMIKAANHAVVRHLYMAVGEKEPR